MMGMPRGPVLPQVPKVKPKGAVRNVFLKNFRKNELQNTIFTKNKVVEMTNDLIKDVDLDGLEKMFSKSTATSAPKVESVQQKKQIVTLIDGKRSYNISLKLGSLRHMSYEQMRQAVFDMNEEAMNEKYIEIFQQIVPTKEECETVMGYDGDVADLGEPEKLFRVLSDIPNLESRISAWIFKQQFLSSVGNVRPSIETFTVASKELQTSQKFSKMLGLILTIINFLNGADPNKISYGFDMSSLGKLNDCKAGNGQTLLQYIVQVAEQKHSELLSLEEELEHVKAATRIILDTLNADVDQIKVGIRKVGEQIELARKAELPNDQFVSVMEPFYEQAVTQLEIIEMKYKEMKDEMGAMRALFREEEKGFWQNPSLFFKMISNFLDSVDNAVNLNSQRKKDEERRLKQQEEKEKKKRLMEERAMNQQSAVLKKRKAAAKAVNEASDLSGHSSPIEGRGVLDAQANKLKDGTIWRQKKRNMKSMGAMEWGQAISNLNVLE